MRIAIHTLGTRGDFQPYLALAVELRRRGHEVLLTAPAQFTGAAAERNVPMAQLPGDFLALLDTQDAKEAVAGGNGFSAGFRLLKHVRPLMRRLFDEEWKACSAFAPDLMVYHPKSLATPHMAERLGVPCVLASPLPGFNPTAAFPSPLMPFATLGPLNRLSHVAAIHGGQWLFRKSLREWREAVLGLPGRGRAPPPVLTLYAYSPNVLPRPIDWGGEAIVTGYWFLEHESWAIPPDLGAFLDAGERPIYIGFGSMPGIDPAVLTRIVADALAKAGRRGLIATGGGAMQAGFLGSHIHTVCEAPHDHLFPLMAAALHHGGAGTTGASLRAGLPTIICPFMADQPFWGRRVHTLGAGPQPLDRKHLSIDKLAAAFAEATAPAIRKRAEEIGSAIRQEIGTEVAADALEATLRSTGAAGS